MNKINYDKVMIDIINNEENIKEKKLLLQTCCAPCSTYVLEELNKYFNIDIYYYNPNIHPHLEEKKRFDTIKKLVNIMNFNDIGLIFPKNDPKEFLLNVNNRKNDKEGGNSCYSCYEFRMRKTAKYAKEHNYDYFCTTLSVSPHKNSVWINEIGKKLENYFKVKYLYSDFKKRNGYKKSVELSKKYELYRQCYCGCFYSLKEMIKRDSNNDLKR